MEPEATAGALQNYDLARALAALPLPPLPNIVRYHDDLLSEWRSIRNIEGADCIVIDNDGCRRPCVFSEFGPVQTVVKHVFVRWIERVAVLTATGYHGGLLSFCRTFGWKALAEIILLPPGDLARHWNYRIRPMVNPEVAAALRAMLHALAAQKIGAWTPADAPRIRSSIRSPRRDKFRKIRLGDSFLSLREQAVVVDFLDHFAAEVSPLTSADALQDAAVLLLCYEHALRPGQSARLERDDTKQYEDGAIHVTIPYRKQRKGSRQKASVRAVRCEWASIIKGLVRRAEEIRRHDAEVPPGSLLQLTPREVSSRVIQSLGSLGLRGNATDLRHTGAQRLADGGASLDEIMLYLCQESNKIAQVYIDASAAQGAFINQALGISEYYGDIPARHRRGYVTQEELDAMPADKVVAGAPHGILTGAVGGCTKGQSVCARSPVLACYGCFKFLPTDDPEIHENLLESMRAVVASFMAVSSRGEGTPPFSQLRATMDAIRMVIADLRRSRQEKGS